MNVITKALESGRNLCCAIYDRFMTLAVAAVCFMVSMASSASATDFAVDDVITSSGLTTKITSGATTLAGILGTLLVIWIAFKLFYKGRRAAGASLG